MKLFLERLQRGAVSVNSKAGRVSPAHADRQMCTSRPCMYFKVLRAPLSQSVSLYYMRVTRKNRSRYYSYNNINIFNIALVI